MKKILLSAVLLLSFIFSRGQNYIVDLSTFPSSGILNKQALADFTVMNLTNQSETVDVIGSMRFRSSGESFKFSFSTSIKPGLNVATDIWHGPTYTFSSSALQNLVKTHDAFPSGEYEYCVELVRPGGESSSALGSDCSFNRADEIFLLNLVEPVDEAKLSESFPLFSWMVNSPLMNELEYKIRVVEVRDGQRKENAIMRNRPVYEQKGLRILTQNYPVTARSLEYFQPYAWTIDAYYRNILIGSAETWEFVLIDQELMAGVPRETAYLDIEKELGGNMVYAVGNLKLKYELIKFSQDELELKLFEGNQRIKLTPRVLEAKKGENRYVLNFDRTPRLKHLKKYRLQISTRSGGNYQVNFQYINPDFL